MLFSCSKSNGNKSNCVSPSAVIVGDLNWQEIQYQEDPNLVHKSKSVGLLNSVTNGQGNICNGFLISPELFITNYHCVNEQSEQVRILFSDNKEQEMFNCSDFIAGNEEIDYAIVSCSGYPGDKFGFLNLYTGEVATQSFIEVIHHNCDNIAESNCLRTKKLSSGLLSSFYNHHGINLLKHDADTLAGSSGAPLFYKDNNSVIGLHAQGVTSMGKGSANLAVPMSTIVNDLKKHSSLHSIIDNLIIVDGGINPSFCQ